MFSQVSWATIRKKLETAFDEQTVWFFWGLSLFGLFFSWGGVVGFLVVFFGLVLFCVILFCWFWFLFLGFF